MALIKVGVAFYLFVAQDIKTIFLEYILEQNFIQLFNSEHAKEGTKPIGTEKEWYNQYRFQKPVDAVTGRMTEAVEERIGKLYFKTPSFK